MYKKRKVNHQLQTFSRSIIVDRFIQSVAASALLCCMVSLPVYVSEMLTNFINTNLKCRATRYIMFVFPVVTIMNYLFIGIERYLGVYQPLRVPSKEASQRIIMLTWLVGAAVTGLLIPSMNVMNYQLPDNVHTNTCMVNNSVTMHRISFVFFVSFGYIIPSTALTITCILIKKYLRRRRSAVLAESVTSPNSLRTAFLRYKVTRMFVSLIFAFVIPCIVFFVHNSVIMFQRTTVSFNVIFTTRMVSACLGISNTAVGSSIMLYSSQYLRQQLIALIRKIVCIKTTSQVSMIELDRNNYPIHCR